MTSGLNFLLTSLQEFFMIYSMQLAMGRRCVALKALTVTMTEIGSFLAVIQACHSVN